MLTSTFTKDELIMPLSQIKRRQFLASSALLTGTIASPLFGREDERPRVKNPRATDGDDQFEPNWEERMTITVGPKKADLVGSSDRVIQAAVDYIARLGGGTVKILPGTYTLRNAVHLPSRIRIQGSGDESIVTKIASEQVNVSEDSDWYDQEITLEKRSGFRVGDGVFIVAKNPHNGGQTTIKRTLVARSGNRFKLNDGLRKNIWLTGKPTVSSLFPLFTSEYTEDVLIENLTFDGNKENNANMNGNYGGCVFLQDCNRYTFKNCTMRNYNGDGLSFQICHDVVVDGCHSHDNGDLGVHPGSGSQRPVIKNTTIENNGIGIFWCWGVRYGLAVDNKIKGNSQYGISIGHCDTDNVIRRNDVIDSGRIGILFRDDARGKDFWANRNVIEDNRVVNSGDGEGVAIEIQGQTKDTLIRNNIIQENRDPMKRVGIKINDGVGNVTLGENSIEGVATKIIDQRRK